MKKSIFIITILVLISLFSHPEWVKSFSVLTHGDWLYQNQATLKEFFAFPAIWSGTSIGGINITGSFYPFRLAFGLLSKLNLSYGIIERLVFMWPILIISPIASYVFLKKLFNNSLGAFIGSFVYCYNTYFLIVGTGHLTHHRLIGRKDLERLGFETHGCVGFVTRKKFKLRLFWDFYDLIAWLVPGLGGNLIGIYKSA